MKMELNEALARLNKAGLIVEGSMSLDDKIKNAKRFNAKNDGLTNDERKLIADMQKLDCVFDHTEPDEEDPSSKRLFFIYEYESEQFDISASIYYEDGEKWVNYQGIYGGGNELYDDFFSVIQEDIDEVQEDYE